MGEKDTLNRVEIANHFRSIAARIKITYPNTASKAKEIADELDPPKPEEGTYCWWRTPGGDWDLGKVGYGGLWMFGRKTIAYWEDFDHIEWKPAHFLGPRQVAVDIRPVDEWPKKMKRVRILMEYWPYYIDEEPWVEKEITREEAEHMGAKDE